MPVAGLSLRDRNVSRRCRRFRSRPWSLSSRRARSRHDRPNRSGDIRVASPSRSSSRSSNAVFTVSSSFDVVFARASTCSAPIDPVASASPNAGASSIVLERRSRRFPSAADTPPHFVCTSAGGAPPAVSCSTPSCEVSRASVASFHPCTSCSSPNICSIRATSTDDASVASMASMIACTAAMLTVASCAAGCDNGWSRSVASTGRRGGRGVVEPVPQLSEDDERLLARRRGGRHVDGFDPPDRSEGFVVVHAPA